MILLTLKYITQTALEYVQRFAAEPNDDDDDEEIGAPDSDRYR